VLTVAKITQTAGAGYAEYLDGRTHPVAAGDYYLKDGDRVEAPGRWVSGADQFGLDATKAVTGKQLRALLDVRRPDTGALLRSVGAGGTAVAALDATFSAPKSVSAVWAIADPRLRSEVEAAHERAIDRAVTYAVDHVSMIRERVSRDEVIHTRPAGVVATSWRHSTARAVAGQVPDPQLHSHVLLHGAVRRDGQVMAIDSRAWLVHRRELGAAYRTELAFELRTLGFEIRRGTGRAGRYFEIDGVPPAVIDRWSSRDREIRAAITARLQEQTTRLTAEAAQGGEAGDIAAERLARLRMSGLAPAENRAVTLATRSPKTAAATHHHLDSAWVSTAQSLGFDPTTVDQLRRPRPQLPVAGEAVLLGRLTEFDATFAEHAARAVALEASVGVRTQDALTTLETARGGGQVLALADGRLTTRAHRAAERETVTAIHRLADARVDRVPERLVVGEVARLTETLRERGEAITVQQTDAIHLACADRQLVVIEGQAGTGKSTVLTAIARAHQANGRQIIVTSTAALGAQRLADELHAAGVDADTYSTAGLHAAITDGRVVLDPWTTVIHDEAALASTREQQHLFTAVLAGQARLIEVGDPAQSRPVGAAGLWPTLQTQSDVQDSRAVLTRNVRAQDPDDRRDQQTFRDGDTETAIAGYDQRGRITVTDDARQAEDRALEAADADRAAGRRTLVIAQTSNEHLDALNARAQAIHHHPDENRDGGGVGVAVPGRPYRLQIGDPVQIRRTFTPDGDRSPVRNGSTGHVTNVNDNTDRVTLTLGGDRMVDLDEAQLAAGDVRLAYVQHPFPAQGQTTDTAHLIVAEHATQHGSYVALTRARQRTDLYASTGQLTDHDSETPIAALAEHLSRSEPDVPSIQVPLAHEADIAVRPDRIESAPAPVAEQEHVPAPVSDTPPHLIAALGERPPTPGGDRLVWETAADGISQYRERYAIPDDDLRPLGSEPKPERFRHRHERARVADYLTAAAQRLDHTALEPDGTSSPNADRERLARERDLDAGYEP
jgi:conjugative relaxase-like TrwC/TraI family protein